MRCAVRTGARGEILGDLAQDLPLLGVRVLRLVDQHVVDAAIELVEHPGRVAAREQRQGLVDEILEVERAETHLRLLDAGVDLGGEREESRRALGGARGLALVDERAHAILLAQQRVLQALADILGEEGRALARRTAIREEDREVVFELVRDVPGLGGSDEGGGPFLVGRLCRPSSSCAMAGQSCGVRPPSSIARSTTRERLVRSQAELPAKPRRACRIGAGTACISAPRR